MTDFHDDGRDWEPEPRRWYELRWQWTREGVPITWDIVGVWAYHLFWFAVAVTVVCHWWS